MSQVKAPVPPPRSHETPTAVRLDKLPVREERHLREARAQRASQGRGRMSRGGGAGVVGRRKRPHHLGLARQRVLRETTVRATGSAVEGETREHLDQRTTLQDA